VYLINTARGKNVDTAAVIAAMKSGKVIGVCLDVLEYESVSFEKLDRKTLPEPFQYLINSDRAILSPHIAGWTFESHEKIGRVIAEKVLRVLLP
jgi:D-3-phosphoglycerate dehydrogenase